MEDPKIVSGTTTPPTTPAQATTPATAPTTPQASPTGPHAEPDDREEVYYEGSPPLRAHTGRVCLYLLITLVLLFVAGLLIHKTHLPWWVPTALIVIALLLPFIPLIMTKAVRYRITNYRIDYERGLLAKQIDTLELWHIEDLRFYQSLIARLVNVGNITIISRDETMPQLLLNGIPNPRPLYETLKQRVIAVKRQRGVLKVDPG